MKVTYKAYLAKSGLQYFPFWLFLSFVGVIIALKELYLGPVVQS